MKILKLTLKRKWFDMILCGEKKEEYREIKKHWNRILHECWTDRPGHYGQCQSILWEQKCKVVFDCPCHKCDVCEARTFDAVEFRNGYATDAPTILIECKGIETGIGNAAWGAPEYEVFIIKLGEIIEKKNIKS